MANPTSINLPDDVREQVDEIKRLRRAAGHIRPSRSDIIIDCLRLGVTLARLRRNAQRLALAEQRRLAAEEKQRIRAEKKAAKR